MCCNMLQVKDKRTGKVFEDSIECVDLNYNGRYVMRHNIGHDGYHEWTPVECIYNNDDFNHKYEVINNDYKSVRECE